MGDVRASSRPSAWWDALGRWLVPAAIHARGREAVIRAQAILAVVVAGFGLGLVSAYIDFRAGTPRIGWLTLGFASAGLAIPFVLRRTGSLLAAGHLLVALLFLLVFTPALLTLGRGPAVLFLFLAPAFAVLFCGRRAALVWALVSLVGVGVLGALSLSPWAAPIELPTHDLRMHRAAVLSLLVATVCLLTYDVVKEAALRDLERANAALHESREQYRQLIEASPDAIFVSDLERVIYANPRALELLGAAREDQIVGRAAWDVVDIPEEEVARMRTEIRAGRRTEGARMTVRTLDGERVPVETSAIPTRFEGAPAVLAVVRDRREEERTLSHLRLLGTVVDQGNEGVLVVDSSGIVRYANEGYARARGLPVEAMVGRPVTELLRDDAARSFISSLGAALEERGGQVGGRFHFEGPAGRRSWDIRIFPVETGDSSGPLRVTLLRDVTHEVELEETARQSQKMEAVGQLAGGIAHDFNNHLTVILGHAEELRASLPPGSPESAEVDAIVWAVERSAALTQQLLTFARRQALDVQLLDLGEVVLGMHEMLRRLLPERIELSVELYPDDLPVLADRGQLEQVVLNLLLNARDAIGGGGEIRIETSLRSPADAGEDEAPAARPPGHAMLRVSDDGQGMDEGVRSRIFEPFFTTKPAGRGTGLGLATVHGIVHQGEGAIEVDSHPGQGTRISVYFPLAEAGLESQPARAPRAPAGPPPRGRVLLVEDEASVRHLGRRALEGAGFEVLEAEDGEHALRLVEERAPDIVVSDIVMPGMSGLELADRIAARHADLPVLLVSGYAEEAAEDRQLRGAGRELLAKPFRPQQLVEHVRRLLDSGRGTG